MRVELPIRLCLRQDEMRNPFRIAGQLAVRHTNHMQSSGFQKCCPLLVTILLSVVSLPIEFYDELMLGTIEVHNIRSKGDLPPKLQSAESSIAKYAPQDTFGRRRFFTKAT